MNQQLKLFDFALNYGAALALAFIAFPMWVYNSFTVVDPTAWITNFVLYPFAALYIVISAAKYWEGYEREDN